MANSDLSVNRGKELLKALVEKSLLSQAQADLVEADCSATGMPVDEILSARGWVQPSVIEELMPSRQETTAKKAKVNLSYDENLKVYRNLLGEILGESSE